MTRMATIADTTNPSTNSPPFDIVEKYLSLLSSDPDLTPPIAAIEALISLLTSSPATTVSETLDLLSTATATLRHTIPNWIALSAGTDLFQRYLTTTLQRPGTLGSGGDFNLLRQHLLSNSRLFVQRAKEAREKIAVHGGPFIRDGRTILTNGGSRVVSAVLQQAASSDRRFQVIYVLPSAHTTDDSSREGRSTVLALRAASIPVATIPDSAVAYSLGKADMVIVGAEGVVENGGIISRLGTYQIGLLAKAMGKPFYVAAETYKFVRMYPLGQYDLPIHQNIVEYKVASSDKGSVAAQQPPADDDTTKIPQNGVAKEVNGKADHDSDPSSKEDLTPPISHHDAVDFTPPYLISALITENGVLTPSAVSEELIKLWF